MHRENQTRRPSKIEMIPYRFCFLGFGNVGRALVRLLVAKSTELRQSYGIEWQITGVATRRMGWLSCIDGFDVANLLSGNNLNASTHTSITDWLQTARPDVLFETTSLNAETGQPAIDYLRASIEAGAHTITANKGPVVYAYDELSQLAAAAGTRFLFESTVMDSAPVFSLFRETLPAARLRGFTGVLNSTTNVILEAMEAGRSFEEGVKAAQELGVAETDPSHDVDGWDSTMKLCAITRVILKSRLSPTDVRRESIRKLTPATLQRARTEGRPFKLVSRLRIAEDRSMTASVMPEQIAVNEPLGSIRGTSLAAHFELDMIPALTVISHRPNLQSTAYGLLADCVNSLR
jgi:homoserine dehydrogenase